VSLSPFPPVLVSPGRHRFAETVSSVHLQVLTLHGFPPKARTKRSKSLERNLLGWGPPVKEDLGSRKGNEMAGDLEDFFFFFFFFFFKGFGVCAYVIRSPPPGAIAMGVPSSIRIPRAYAVYPE